VDHLRKASVLAEERSVSLVLENHNKEPEHAEIHYIPYTSDELVWYLDHLPSPNLSWTFETGHANLVPEGVIGFLDRVGIERLGQIRLSDNHGDFENHLAPGQGNVDFDPLIERLGELGWQGPCMLSFGPMKDVIAARDHFRERLS
jgi:sugar phosphate isomerase/epimerase